MQSFQNIHQIRYHHKCIIKINVNIMIDKNTDKLSHNSIIAPYALFFYMSSYFNVHELVYLKYISNVQ